MSRVGFSPRTKPVLSHLVMRGEPGGRLYAESLTNILAVHLLRDYAQCADGRMLEACSAGDEAALGIEQHGLAAEQRYHSLGGLPGCLSGAGLVNRDDVRSFGNDRDVAVARGFDGARNRFRQ
jgi:hypothetical protein